MALGLILEINGYKYKLLKYNRRFNQKRHCIVLPFLAQAESTVHMLNWAIRSVKFLGVEFD